MKAVCVYFKREGYCAKGDLCTFSHVAASTAPCKLFFDPSGKSKCKFAEACFFSHTRSAPSLVRRAQVPAHVPSPALPSVSSPAPAPAPAPAPPLTTAGNACDELARFDMNAVLESLWDHSDGGGGGKDALQGAYFYGAAGAGSFQGEGGKEPANWASVAKKVADPQDANSTQSFPAHPSKGPVRRERVVCPFFATGNCRYGSRCLNIHSLDGSDADIRQSSASASSGDASHEAQQPSDEQLPPDECGICMASRPEDGLYGVLSCCDCCFCLQCIRQWRTQHGKEVSSSSSQVRLCPLCRVESFFTIPSLKFLRRGERKELLITKYREQLKKTPCKFSFAAQVCPFGSSCFYLHRDEDRTSVHHLLNGNGEVEVRGEGGGASLFDFVSRKLDKKGRK